MMTAQYANPLLNTRGVDLASGGITDGDWLSFTGGAVMGMLVIAVAIAIAWWQRIIEVRDRTTDRAAQERRDQEEREQQLRLGRRDVWRADYVEIRELLKLGEDIAYHTTHSGPLTAAELSDLHLSEFKVEAHQLAGRTIEALREPLQRLADLAEHIAQSAVPEPAEVTAAYSAARHKPVPTHLQPRAVQVRAVQQDRVSRELSEAVAAAWKALRDEWGS